MKLSYLVVILINTFFLLFYLNTVVFIIVFDEVFQKSVESSYLPLFAIEVWSNNPHPTIDVKAVLVGRNVSEQ